MGFLVLNQWYFFAFCTFETLGHIFILFLLIIFFFFLFFFACNFYLRKLCMLETNQNNKNESSRRNSFSFEVGRPHAVQVFGVVAATSSDSRNLSSCCRWRRRRLPEHSVGADRRLDRHRVLPVHHRHLGQTGQRGRDEHQRLLDLLQAARLEPRARRQLDSRQSGGGQHPGASTRHQLRLPRRRVQRSRLRRLVGGFVRQDGWRVGRARSCDRSGSQGHQLILRSDHLGSAQSL